VNEQQVSVADKCWVSLVRSAGSRTATYV